MLKLNRWGDPKRRWGSGDTGGREMRQSGNRITGVKGYKGTNVIIASGVQHTYVELGGSESTSTDLAVVNNSGNATNVIIDNYTQS